MDNLLQFHRSRRNRRFQMKESEKQNKKKMNYETLCNELSASELRRHVSEVRNCSQPFLNNFLKLFHVKHIEGWMKVGQRINCAGSSDSSLGLRSKLVFYLHAEGGKSFLSCQSHFAFANNLLNPSSSSSSSTFNRLNLPNPQWKSSNWAESFSRFNQSKKTLLRFSSDVVYE